MDKIFVDSGIFIVHCMIGDDRLIKLLQKYELITTPSVIEESFYKSLFLRAETVYGKSSKHTLKEKYLKEQTNFEPIYKYFADFLKSLNYRLATLSFTGAFLFLWRATEHTSLP